MAILGREKFSIRHSRHITIPVRVTIFPYEWLSSCGKKKILHSRLRRSWRIFFSPRLLSHSWGKIVTCTGIVMCLSWLIENFKFLYSRLRRSYRNFPVPKLPNDIIGSIPNTYWRTCLWKKYILVYSYRQKQGKKKNEFPYCPFECGRFPFFFFCFFL